MIMSALARTVLSAWLLGGITPSLRAQDAAATGPAVRIHSVTDIAHEFTFYFDGRFAQNYIDDSRADARNWATLHKADLKNVNLLILQSGASPCPYLPQDIEAVRQFLAGGGGVLVLGDFALFREEREYRLNELLRDFDAEFSDQPLRKPLKAVGTLHAPMIESSGGETIRLTDASRWEVLIQDSEGRPVLVRRRVGKGWLAAGSRSLCGSRPDAQDPINAEWWKPLLQELAGGKRVDPAHPPVGSMPENTVDKGGLRLRYTDYLAPYADEIFRMYERCRPALERILGVPPAPDMLTSIILLPTGGGGFSSGREIGLGIWWGDFPQKQYGMIELLGHEGTHSWVLPFAEPMWNEGLATYVGILLGRELAHEREADAALNGWLEAARRHDPNMNKYDLAGGKDVPHEVAMGKPMWIFEELRKEKPDIVARYFRAKRQLVDPEKMKNYTADDSIAVLSHALGRDLFPWFQSLGIRVDAGKTNIDHRSP
jgi:hypothetical protein